MMSKEKWVIVRIVIYLIVGIVLFDIANPSWFRANVINFILSPQLPPANTPEGSYARLPSVTRAQFLDLIKHCEVSDVTRANVGIYFRSKIDDQDYRISDGISPLLIAEAINAASSTCGPVGGGIE